MSKRKLKPAHFWFLVEIGLLAFLLAIVVYIVLK